MITIWVPLVCRTVARDSGSFPSTRRQECRKLNLTKFLTYRMATCRNVTSTSF